MMRKLQSVRATLVLRSEDLDLESSPADGPGWQGWHGVASCEHMTTGVDDALCRVHTLIDTATALVENQVQHYGEKEGASAENGGDAVHRMTEHYKTHYAALLNAIDRIQAERDSSGRAGAGASTDALVKQRDALRVEVYERNRVLKRVMDQMRQIQLVLTTLSVDSCGDGGRDGEKDDS